MRKPRIPGPLVLVLAATIAACTVSEGMGLIAVSRAISNKYKEPARVSLANELRLEITFANSSYATAPEADAEKFAHEVALTAYAAYAERDSIQLIAVGFSPKPGTSVDSLSHFGVPYVYGIPFLKAGADSAARAAAAPR